MNLRVFKPAEEALAVEVSSPGLKSTFKWFVPLLPDGSEKLKGLKQADLVKVAYGNGTFYVPFMLIRTVRIEEGHEKIAGTLNEQDSINILNNIYDRLAYDALPAMPIPKKALK